MSEVTSPILLDSTGQTTNTKLDNINTTLGQIKTVLTTPSEAEDISYDNTQSGMTATDVQDAVDELNSSLTNSTPVTDTQNGVTLSYVIRGNILYGYLSGTPTTTNNITFSNLPKPLLPLFVRQQQWGNATNTLNYYIETNSTTLTLRGHTQNNCAQNLSYVVE